jgi:hypothetical protein
VFDSPEHCEDYRDMFDYPAEGTPNLLGARDRPASPADPVPPVEHHAPLVRGAQTALQAKTDGGCNAPPAAQRGEPPAFQSHSIGDRLC